MFDIKKRLNRLGATILAGVAAAASLIVPSSCTDDTIYDDGIGINADGTFGPFDLQIPIDTEKGDSKTRANFNTTDIQIKKIWIAMFDTETGNIVAMNDTVFANSSADSNHATGAGLYAKLHSIMFNRSTKEAYLVGVANTDGVMTMDKYEDGTPVSLDSALYHVKNIKDYKNICVDVASAERAMYDSNGSPVNAPLMSGFWGTQHGNYTVNLSGKVYSDKEGGRDDGHTAIPLFDTKTLKVTAQTTVNETNGMIHLRRLYSHINVNATFGSEFTSVSNPRVEVYNMPSTVFLQEHKTVENAYTYDASSWRDATDNATALYPETNLNKGVISLDNPGKCLFDGEEKDAVAVNAEDALSINGKTVKFGYWHYETKNWGYAQNVNSINDREKMYGNSKVFSSLCPSENDDFNNNAPYFILSADVETAQYKGRAEFLIHEGYCCDAYGVQIPVTDNSADTEKKRSLDFSTFRNTNYTYNISIEGLNSFRMKVENEDLSGDYYHGVGGELWGKDGNLTQVNVPSSYASSYKISIPSDCQAMYWAIDDGSGSIYGVGMGADAWSQTRFSGFPASVSSPTADQLNGFYKNVSIDGKSLNEYDGRDVVSQITFNAQQSYNAKLYLCALSTSADGMARYYTVYCFNQAGLKLDRPVLTLDRVTHTGPLVMGIDDHTVFWHPVTGADSYTISLKESTFSITLRPGETYYTNDANNFTMTLNQEANGKLSFRVRYARSQGGMLSLFADDKAYGTAKATISVVANYGDTHSEPGEISFTAANPVWDFNTKEWQDVALPKRNADNTFNTNVNVTFNGLTMFTGNSAKMTYLQYSGVYGFRPNGQGGPNDTNTEINGRAFSFRAIANGKINVTTSATGNAASGRHVKTAQRLSNGLLDVIEHTEFDASKVASGNTSNTSGNLNIDVRNTDGTMPNTYVFNSADIVFYKILFTPQDR